MAIVKTPRSRVLHASRIRLLPGIAVLAGTLLLAACTATHSATRAAPALPRGPYVALGDSYTSGPDIPNQVGTPTGCMRSDHNYPALVAQHLKPSAKQVRDVSCSDATIANLTAPQATDSGTNPPQLNALSADTALVTIGIGGNDLDFTAVLTRCVELDLPGTLLALARHGTADLAPCRTSYTAGGTDQIQQKIRTVAAPLEDALTRIRRRAPHARVYVIGYPALLPSGGTSCARKLGITAGDVAFLDAEETQLNAMLRRQAQAAHDTYVDTYTPSIGHDACSDPATRWIEPLITDAAAAPLHPNALGEQEIADAVERAMETEHQ